MTRDLLRRSVEQKPDLMLTAAMNVCRMSHLPQVSYTVVSWRRAYTWNEADAAFFEGFCVIEEKVVAQADRVYTLDGSVLRPRPLRIRPDGAGTDAIDTYWYDRGIGTSELNEVPPSMLPVINAEHNNIHAGNFYVLVYADAREQLVNKYDATVGGRYNNPATGR